MPFSGLVGCTHRCCCRTVLGEGTVRRVFVRMAPQNFCVVPLPFTSGDACMFLSLLSFCVRIRSSSLVLHAGHVFEVSCELATTDVGSMGCGHAWSRFPRRIRFHLHVSIAACVVRRRFHEGGRPNGFFTRRPTSASHVRLPRPSRATSPSASREETPSVWLLRFVTRGVGRRRASKSKRTPQALLRRT